MACKLGEGDPAELILRRGDTGSLAIFALMAIEAAAQADCLEGAISLTVTGPPVVEARLICRGRAPLPCGGANLLLALLPATSPLRLPRWAGLLPHQAAMHAYSALPYASSWWQRLCAAHRGLAGRRGARRGETQAQDNRPLTSREHKHDRVWTGLAVHPLLHETPKALGRGSQRVGHGDGGEGRERRDRRLD
jgi:hypothetical protein